VSLLTEYALRDKKLFAKQREELEFQLKSLEAQAQPLTQSLNNLLLKVRQLLVLSHPI
jgi:hypothetical protein